MVKASILSQMETCMKESSMKASIMEQANKHFLAEQRLKEAFIKGKSMGKVCLNGPMDRSILGNLSMIRWLDKARISGQMAPSIRVNG